ncbi:hypothetical protein QBC46DRAFT_339123 [Diplogelasinospora grovesii]|uniref:Uncharacterized protein n=1 Tax=Diplogelasinospora grovesii TaxID=303347 RepID=A0AAN6NBS4_9PEZI|nr:hypothetical protein QBC46DRAFT_339123 [Diplogelasinospora grovesii]
MLSSRVITRVGASVARPSTTRAVVPRCQTRKVGTGPKNDTGLGGPGGQELYPFSNPVHRKYAMITAAGVLAACGWMYMKKRPENEKSTDATGAAK